MDRATAKVIAVAALRSAAEINNLVPLLKAICPEQEYEAWRDRIAEASMRVTQGLLPTVFAEHADLEAEIEAHYQRFWSARLTSATGKIRTWQPHLADGSIGAVKPVVILYARACGGPLPPFTELKRSRSAPIVACPPSS